MGDRWIANNKGPRRFQWKPNGAESCGGSGGGQASARWHWNSQMAARTLVELDGEPRAVLHFAMPVQFLAHMPEIIADTIDIPTHTVAMMAAVEFVFHMLEIATDAI